MPMSVWHCNGYGIKTGEIRGYSLEQLQKLLEKAPNFKKEMEDWFSECDIEEPTLEDYLDYDQDYYGGIAYILKNVIKEAEDIDFTYCSDHNGVWYLILTPSYPWNMTNPKELNLSEEKVKAIFMKYIEILTDVVPNFDYWEVEDF